MKPLGPAGRDLLPIPFFRMLPAGQMRCRWQHPAEPGSLRSEHTTDPDIGAGAYGWSTEIRTPMNISL